MAFGKLEVFGTVGYNTHITRVQVYMNGQVTDQTSYLLRDRYDISRMYTKNGTGTAVNPKSRPVMYDTVRFVHTWTGHVDVETETICQVPGNNNTPINFLSTAIFFGDGPEKVITYSFPQHGSSSTNEGSLFVQNGTAEELLDAWPYGYTEDEVPLKKTTNIWLIKNVSIIDNQNGTSRVIITLTGWSDLFDLGTEIERISLEN